MKPKPHNHGESGSINNYDHSDNDQSEIDSLDEYGSLSEYERIDSEVRYQPLDNTVQGSHSVPTQSSNNVTQESLLRRAHSNIRLTKLNIRIALTRA